MKQSKPYNITFVTVVIATTSIKLMYNESDDNTHMTYKTNFVKLIAESPWSCLVASIVEEIKFICN